VTSNTKSRSSRGRNPLTRLLSLLLFAFIIHGATAEIVHSHGGASLARHVVNTTTPAVSDPLDSDSSSQKTRTLNECVICQLHQNLSTTLFTALPWMAPPTEQFTSILASATTYFSPASTPQRGRAPPLASLS
jgi:hypothetical protein